MSKKNYLIVLLLAGVLFGFSPSKTPVLRSNSGNIILECQSNYGMISATNHKVKSAYELSTGRLQFSVLVNDIYFEKAILQEKFNSHFMESNQFPLVTFNGVINNNALINLAKNGTYSSAITGDLRIKGVTKQVSTLGSFIVVGNKLKGVATFYAKPSDFNISIPDYAKNEISDKIKINVSIEYLAP